MRTDQAVTVLFISGYGHSGSTLLDRLLGSIEGFFSVGEVSNFWVLYPRKHLCSCGVPINECHFWRSVIKEAFGVTEDSPHIIGRYSKHLNLICNKGNLMQLLFPALRSETYQKELGKIINTLSSWYAAIAKVSGCRVIVDSSKSPLYGYLLSEVPNIDLRVVHLVRDPRAVVYSLIRKKSLRGYVNYSITKTTFGWMFYNILAEALRWKVMYTSRVHYEELVTCPRPTLLRIIKELHLKESMNGNVKLNFITKKRSVRLGAGHICSGNRMRFQQGEISLTLDVEWTKRLNLPQRMVVTAMTWPFLLKYYFLGAPRRLRC